MNFKRRTVVALLAVVASMMAFGGTASATTLTSPEGTQYTSEIDSHAFNSTFAGSFVTVKCGHSWLEGDVWSHGVFSVNVNLSDLVFTECNYWVSVRKEGSLTIDSSNTVVSNGAEIEISTSIGTCIFTTSNTTIGSLTEGKAPDIDVNSAKIPRTGGNFLCGSSGTWTGSYDIYNPWELWVD